MVFARALSPNMLRLLLAAAGLSLAAGCSRQSTAPVIVSIIGDDDELAKPLLKLPHPAAKLMLETTAQGLVAFDASGDILPALAQRWIVVDEGRSYIFRLRRAFWADGTRVTATDIARILTARIESLRRLDPEGPLDAIEAVVPMTGEVIELRLATARPYVLQMLAQPQMAILARNGGTGPYRQRSAEDYMILTPVDEATGDDIDAQDEPPPAWETRIVRAERAALAIVRFREGRAALVLGGRFADLPLLARAEIDRDMVQTDPVQGLFGLAVVGKGKFLDDGAVRAAINMVVDRTALSSLFPLGGWATTTQLLPGQLDLPTPPTRPDWASQSMEERRARAAAVMTRWRADEGEPPTLRIALPEGPGATLLYGLLSRDLAAIGLTTERVGPEAKADLLLVDEVAAYDSALWYLGRIGCARKVHCSKEADAQMQAASLATSAEERLGRVAQAEALMVAHQGFIPLAAPVRWSLVSRRLNGFKPSPRARHPLNHLFRATN